MHRFSASNQVLYWCMGLWSIHNGNKQSTKRPQKEHRTLFLLPHGFKKSEYCCTISRLRHVSYKLVFVRLSQPAWQRKRKSASYNTDIEVQRRILINEAQWRVTYYSKAYVRPSLRGTQTGPIIDEGSDRFESSNEIKRSGGTASRCDNNPQR